MIKIENNTGLYIKEEIVNFQKGIDIILLKLSESYKEVKTLTLTSINNGIAINQCCNWDKNNINMDWFNDNFIITDGRNSISINKDANIIIRDRKKLSHSFDIVFTDFQIVLTGIY